MVLMDHQNDTRDLATRSAESSSPGSNVFLLNLGAMWLPTESLMTMLSVTELSRSSIQPIYLDL